MTREDKLAELLEKWEAVSTNAPTLTAEDLCRDCPDLLPDFRQLLARLGPVNAVLVGDGIGDVPAEEFVPDIDAGRYRPLSYHARGGLGMVFVAEDSELDRRVALKCMQRLASEDAGSRRRFLSEAAITGKLEHPGIVPVYGLGQDARGMPFYAMRFIQGATLGETVELYHKTTSLTTAERNVELRRLLRHFIAVCETMAYAHDQGVIHRDLKPANIMIGPYGETLVVDWGLAKHVVAGAIRHDSGTESFQALLKGGRSADVSIMGQAKGSPAYMSPEQARGEWDRVGPASDVYSLGSTLFVLLTGKLPYVGLNVFEVLDKVKAGACLTPREVNSSVAPALEAVCRKAMAFQPEHRYANARELAKDLERWLADEPVVAWREPFAVRTRRWLKRNRTLVSSSVAMLLVGLFAAVALAAQERHNSVALRSINRDLETKNDLLDQAKQNLTTKNLDLKKVNLDLVDANQREEKAKNTAIKERDRAEENRDLAQNRLYQFMMYLASAAMTSYDYERVEDFLVKAAPQPGEQQDYRHYEWYRSWHALHKACGRSFKIGANPSSLQISEDGSILAARCGGNSIVYRVADGEPLLTLPAGPTTAFALARNGRFLVFMENNTLEIWGLPAEGRPTANATIKAFDTPVHNHFALSANGRVIVTATGNGRIRTWNAADGKMLKEFEQFIGKKGEDDTLQNISISPDGEWIWFNRSFENPILFEVATAREVKPEMMIERSFKPLEPVKNYRFLDFTNVNRLYARFGEELWSWELSPLRGFSVADARKQTVKEDFREMWEVPVEGEEPMLYLYGSKQVFGIRSPVFWETPRFSVQFPIRKERLAGTPARFRVATPYEMAAFTVRPDGKVLVAADRFGQVTFLDAEHAAEPELLLRHPNQGAVADLSFMPDGQLISLSGKGSFLKARPGGAPEWNLQAEEVRDYTIALTKFPRPSMAVSTDGRWFAVRTKENVEILNTANLDDNFVLNVQQYSWSGTRVPLAFAPGKNVILLASERNDAQRNMFTLKPSNLIIWEFGNFAVQSRPASLIAGTAVQRIIEQKIYPTTVRGIETPAHINAIDVSPDGKWAAAACQDKRLRIWSLAKFTQRPSFEIRTASPLQCVRFAPNSQFVVTGDSDGKVWICPIEVGAEATPIPAHRGSVHCLIFDRDGRTIISGGSDGQIKFLIRELPYEVFAIDNGAPVQALALAPDGLSLATGDDVGYVRLFRAATPKTVLELARRQWEELPDNVERSRQLLLALWGTYLDHRKTGEPDAKKLLQEAVELGQKMDDKMQKTFSAWLRAFAEELEKAAPESRE